jgi:hypothetical protein
LSLLLGFGDAIFSVDSKCLIILSACVAISLIDIHGRNYDAVLLCNFAAASIWASLSVALIDNFLALQGAVYLLLFNTISILAAPVIHFGILFVLTIYIFRSW